MIPSEIIEKAIRRAINSGWGLFGHALESRTFSWTYTSPTLIVQSVDEGGIKAIDNYRIEEIIFNKSFNQHLWGAEPYYMMEAKYQHEFNPDGTNKAIEFRAGGIWEYRMIQILMAEDPIKKLAELLEL